MYRKRVRLSGTVYELVVARLSETYWYWVGFVLLKGNVLEMGGCQKYREEAMKDAYCMANMHAGIRQDYPPGYWRGWRRLRLPALDMLISHEERLDRARTRARTKVQ
jgi:hypothetical protein